MVAHTIILFFKELFACASVALPKYVLAELLGGGMTDSERHGLEPSHGSPPSGGVRERPPHCSRIRLTC